MGDQKIDRKKIKDPREVSGWNEGGGQDFSDMARGTERNAEFMPPYGTPEAPSAEGGKESGGGRFEHAEDRPGHRSK